MSSVWVNLLAVAVFPFSILVLFLIVGMGLLAWEEAWWISARTVIRLVGSGEGNGAVCEEADVCEGDEAGVGDRKRCDGLEVAAAGVGIEEERCNGVEVTGV
jgi:hypothetical protein